MPFQAAAKSSPEKIFSAEKTHISDIDTKLQADQLRGNPAVSPFSRYRRLVNAAPLFKPVFGGRAALIEILAVPHTGKVHQNHVVADPLDIPPADDQIFSPREKPHKAPLCRYDDGLDSAFFQIQLYILHKTETPPVVNIDDFLISDIICIHSQTSLNSSIFRTSSAAFASFYSYAPMGQIIRPGPRIDI